MTFAYPDRVDKQQAYGTIHVIEGELRKVSELGLRGNCSDMLRDTLHGMSQREMWYVH